MKSKSDLCFGAVPYPDTGMVNTNPDVERLKNEISWNPQFSVEQGIKKVIEKQKSKWKNY